MSARRTSMAAAVAILAFAGVLRAVWLTADPATGTATSVGVVWHDEGAWVHNARNQALWGVWRTDEWNPLFITPVFTGLEAAAFNAFGVGTWQARTVPAVSGLISVVALMWGLWAVGGRRSALIGGALLATSYTFVMWNRAALMESTMTMFIVIGWAAYASAYRRPRWGVLAGVAVVLAFFTKAAAAFFAGAIALELVMAWWVQSPGSRVQGLGSGRWTLDPGLWTTLGLAFASVVALALFVIPNWTEFQFYNWQMTVTRKPDYSLGALVDRTTWLPVTHGVFTRMWLIVLVAAAAAAVIVSRWRSAHPAERLVVLWLMVGLVELVVHDSGNERRYVMFVPALVALASLRLAQQAHQHDSTPARQHAGTSAPFARAATVLTVAVLGYVVFGSALRLLWLDDVLANEYSMTVRVSAALAAASAALVWWRWNTFVGWLATARVPLAATAAVVVITCGTDLVLFTQWAGVRTFHNYDASRALGAMLPPRTLVHGKLANGLALENTIAPLFIGTGFGNYADRLSRNDARYILTYTQPRLGHEGVVILDVLKHYPQQRIITEFEVAAFEIDATAGAERAALIDKFPDGPEPRARHQ